MKLYYIEYEDANHEVRVEAFKSKTAAQKRIRELKAEAKKTREEWQEYIISGKHKPTKGVLRPPTAVCEVGFELNSDGITSAFLYYIDKRGNHGHNRRS
jgi:hypothetical protein